jgi:hypothetical protein
MSVLAGKRHVIPARNDVIFGESDIILAGDDVIPRQSFQRSGQN